MTPSTLIAWDPTIERELRLLEIDDVEGFPRTLDLPSSHYAAFVAWDSTGASQETIEAFLTGLLRTGATHICFWGEDNIRVKTVMDDLTEYAEQCSQSGNAEESSAEEDTDLQVIGRELIRRNNDVRQLATAVVTFADEYESLGESLSILLDTSIPEERYAPTTRCSLAICVGSSDWAPQISQRMKTREDLPTFAFGGNARRVDWGLPRLDSKGQVITAEQEYAAVVKDIRSRKAWFAVRVVLWIALCVIGIRKLYSISVWLTPLPVVALLVIVLVDFVIVGGGIEYEIKGDDELEELADKDGWF